MVEPLFEELGPQQVSGILPRGGTIIGTSRTNPFKLEDGVERVLRNFADRELDALVAIGGEDTLGVAARLHAEHGLPVVGVPKTIDNDLSGTDYTFGFDTAVSIATEAIDRLHTTAESHNRVMVVEVMGRHAGWIAVHSGIAGGADVILIPEIPVDFDEVAETIRKRHARGKNFSIVVVSEGTELPGLAADGETDQFGHVTLSERGVGETLGHEIEERTGFETRVTVLGHIQRGGTPTARDRVLATRFGLKAADLALAGEFGQMAALRGRRDRRRPARGGDRRAEARAARLVRGRERVLRLAQPHRDDHGLSGVARISAAMRRGSRRRNSRISSPSTGRPGVRSSLTIRPPGAVAAKTASQSNGRPPSAKTRSKGPRSRKARVDVCPRPARRCPARRAAPVQPRRAPDRARW